MKHPFLFGFLVFSLSVTTVPSFVSLNAAEIWNKGTATRPGTEEGSKPRYYNAPKSRAKSQQTKKHKYYNTPGEPEYNLKKNGFPGGVAALRSVPKAVLAKQRKLKKPEQFKYMSPYAVESREADIEIALLHEYHIAKDNAAKIAESKNSAREAYLAGERKHQAMIAKRKEERKKHEEELEKRKERAYQKYLSTSKIHKGGDRSVNNSTKTKVNRLGLKKPTRLFNDPND